MRRDRERLQDLLEAIEKIQRETKGGRSAFDKDEKTRVWVVHHLEIMGEAARAIGDDLKAKHPEIPWTMISGIRNRLAHEYFDVNEDIVWNVVEMEVPKLKAQVDTIMKTIGK